MNVISHRHEAKFEFYPASKVVSNINDFYNLYYDIADIVTIFDTIKIAAYDIANSLDKYKKEGYYYNKKGNWTIHYDIDTVDKVLLDYNVPYNYTSKSLKEKYLYSYNNIVELLNINNIKCINELAMYNQDIVKIIEKHSNSKSKEFKVLCQFKTLKNRISEENKHKIFNDVYNYFLKDIRICKSKLL